MIGFQVPLDTARLLSEIDVPGQRTAPDHQHITVIHLGKDVAMPTIIQAIEATFRVVETIRPFTLQTSRLTCFPKNEDGVPIICPIESQELHTLQKRLCAALDRDGVEYSRKYPEYKPHTTLSYAEQTVPDQEIQPLEWGAHELVLWAGDPGNRKMVVHFPFSLKNRLIAKYRESVIS